MYDDFSSPEFKKFVAEMEKEMNSSKGSGVEKFPITDEAIKNIPYIKYRGLKEDQCLRIQELEQILLSVSRFKNNCNEVAITYRLDGDEFLNEQDRMSIVYGEEGEVNIFSDEKTKKLFETAKELVILSMHNHPNGTSFSFNDLAFFYSHDEIKIFVVVTNTGKVNSISRTDLYTKGASLTRLVEMLKEKVPRFKELSFEAVRISVENKKKAYAVMKEWFKHLKEFGMRYEDGVLKSGIAEKEQRRKVAKNKRISRRGFAR